MPKFTVNITRSAVESIDLAVEAESQDAAYDKIADALNKPHRVTVNELTKLQGVKVVYSDFYPVVEVCGHTSVSSTEEKSPALNWTLPGTECPRCKGNGRVGIMACNDCGATGRALPSPNDTGAA